MKNRKCCNKLSLFIYLFWEGGGCYCCYGNFVVVIIIVIIIIAVVGSGVLLSLEDIFELI